MKNIKFTIELVWHNCLECPPKESDNNCLFITDRFSVWEVEYHNGEWFTVTDCIQPVDITENHYWADIEQTVQGDERFRSKK